MCNNQIIAKIFYEISEILSLKNVQWKPQAYNKAARVIDDLDKDVRDIYNEKGLKGLDEIPNVGKGIAKKIEEFLKTGKIKEFEKLKKSIPKGLTELMEVEGIGPKKAKQLYEKLKIKNIKDLERAVKKHKIQELERFGEKSEKDIEESIKNFKSRPKKRLLIGRVLPIAEHIIDELKQADGVKQVIACGSLRRMYETIGDIDLLATSSNPKNIVDKFTKLKEVKRILAKGSTKGMVLLDNNLQADIRVVNENIFGSALQYFTGSKDHSIKLRGFAIKKGLKLSEYGLFDKNKRIACKTEEDIYKKLGMQFIPAELRENRGEIEVALNNKIPKLINYNEIKGDLHVHSNWSDGGNTIKEIVEAAKQLNYDYIGISDHSQTRKIANGLDKYELEKQIKEIKKIRGIKVLAGSEVDILGDGSLDFNDNLLKKLDYVIAAIHSGFKQNVTKRILNAMENKNVTIIAHPTGRLIERRSECKLDFDEICRVARETNTLLEINAHQERLDLRDELIKRAVENKVKLIINTDTHTINDLKFMKLGIGQARRGWATKKDIPNTENWDKFL